MYYFKEDEAVQVKNILDRYKGKVMKYSPEKEGEVIGVEIQPAAAKIAYYGEVEEGYLVVVIFKNHPGLVAPLFCTFNGIQPIEATHRAISEGEVSQLITNKQMYGKWTFRKDFDKLNLNISKGEVTIVGQINNEKLEEIFSSDGHWLNSYNFFFMDNPYYMLNFANENHLGLSKLRTPGTVDGNYQWQFKFERVLEVTGVRKPGFATAH